MRGTIKKLDSADVMVKDGKLKPVKRIKSKKKKSTVAF